MNIICIYLSVYKINTYSVYLVKKSCNDALKEFFHAKRSMLSAEVYSYCLTTQPHYHVFSSFKILIMINKNTNTCSCL